MSHIFSDKTGTLTCNVMDFRKFSVGGVSYGLVRPASERSLCFKQHDALVNSATLMFTMKQGVHVHLGAAPFVGKRIAKAVKNDRLSPWFDCNAGALPYIPSRRSW